MLLGIIANRDLRFIPSNNFAAATVGEFMTKAPLHTAKVGVEPDEAYAVLREHKIEKLPLVDDDYVLRGLITVKDFVKSEVYPLAAKDGQGRLSWVRRSASTATRTNARLARGGRRGRTRRRHRERSRPRSHGDDPDAQVQPRVP